MLFEEFLTKTLLVEKYVRNIFLTAKPAVEKFLCI